MVKAVKTPDAQIVTGNRLIDGAVVYLTADAAWSTEIDRGDVARDAAAADRAMAVAKQAMVDRIVVDPYLIEVVAKDGRIEPVGTRERIRAFGPSILPAFADRQARKSA